MHPLDLLARALATVFFLFALYAAVVAIKALWRALHPRNIGRATGIVEQKARAAVDQFKQGRGSGS